MTAIGTPFSSTASRVMLLGAELFIKGDDVWFSEVSPRPRDTGMVALISQNLSEFDLHTHAFLGLPIPAIRQHTSCPILGAVSVKSSTTDPSL